MTRSRRDVHALSPRISVVIPAYNEAANLPHVLALLPEHAEVVLVDGQSTDGTVAVTRALRPDATILQQERRGRGDALASGLAAATGEIIVTLDADGSTDPREIPRFVDALVRGADIAKGTRFAPGGGSNDLTLLRAWGNRRLSRVASLLFRDSCSDVCYGFTAFWARCLPSLQLSSGTGSRRGRRLGDGFEFAAVLKSRAVKAHLRTVEVPSLEHRRAWGESNLHAWRDGTRVLLALLAERISGSTRRR